MAGQVRNAADDIPDLPGWDDRKKLHEVFQRQFTIPEGISLSDLTPALIDVATWGYRRRYEEEKDWPYGTDAG